MVYKRPFGEEESHEFACKHPRQLEHSNQRASFVEIVPCSEVSQKPHTSDEDGFGKTQGDKRVVYDTVTDLSVEADKVFETPGIVSSLLWFTNSTSEADARSEAAVRVSFSPRCFEPDRSTRVLIQSEEIYSSLLDPPHRLVSVGSDHQADVPVWDLQGVRNASSSFDTSDPQIAFPQSLGSDLMVNDSNRKEFMGTCVISMPDLESSAYIGDKVDGRTDCQCLDGGSVRCVRQHVMEAREKLKRTLGLDRFVELGFCDMGEEVAQKWSEEEEQLFHEIVFTNPASLGKNFWEHLSLVFPSRSKKDIVSYYFNVFMLRRRAEQNRSYPLNIDSDNDEWQESEDEPGVTEEEDSVVDSPVERGDPVYNQDNFEEDFHEDDEDGDEIFNNDNNGYDGGNRGCADEEDEEGVDDVSEAQSGKSLSGCSFNPVVQLAGKNPVTGVEDHDVQDDSCTSYECQASGADSCGPVDMGARTRSDYNQRFHGSYDGLSGVDDHVYVLEPSDSKVWDAEYLTSLTKDVDLLPTCNMIEEVFGEEAWNNNARNDKNIS